MADTLVNVAAIVPAESLGEARSAWRTLGLYHGRRPPFALRLAPPGGVEPTFYGQSSSLTRDQLDNLEALRVLGKTPAGLVVGEGILPELLKQLGLAELPPPPAPPPKPVVEPVYTPWLKDRRGWRALKPQPTEALARARLQEAAAVPDSLIAEACVLTGGTPDNAGGHRLLRSTIVTDPEILAAQEEIAKKLHAASALASAEGVAVADVGYARAWAVAAAARLEEATRLGKRPGELLGTLNGIARAADSRLLEMVAGAADTLRRLLGPASRRVRAAAAVEVERLSGEARDATDSGTSAIMNE